MRIFVLGANGHTGTQILDLALDRSHQATAFVRGDPRDADQMAKSLDGHDAVLSALGVRRPRLTAGPE